MCNTKFKGLNNWAQDHPAREWQILDLHPGLSGFQLSTPASLLQLLWSWVSVTRLSVGRLQENAWLWMGLCLPAWTNAGWGINSIYICGDCWQVFRDCRAREGCQKTAEGTHCSNLQKGTKLILQTIDASPGQSSWRAICEHKKWEGTNNY